MVPPGDLLDFQGDLKSLSRSAFQKLRKEILELGFAEPVTVWKRSNGQLYILNGHQRVRVVRQLIEQEGMVCPLLPISYAEPKDEKEAKKMVLALTSQYGKIDDEGLYEFVTSAGIDPKDITESFRFPDLKLDKWVDSYFKKESAAADKDDAPEPPKIPITKLGDLITLGKHRILCADSTQTENLKRLMGDERAAAAFTDPPYAIFGSSSGVTSNVADDRMVRPFFQSVVRIFKSHVKEAGHVFICCDWRSWSAWWDVARQSQLPIKNCIVWDKGAVGLGSMFQNTHEFVLFATNDRKPDVTMSSSVKGKTPQRTVAGVSNVWTIPRDRDRQHGAQKPVELSDRALNASTDEGDLVLDPFLGAGTTLISCEGLGRKCYGLEVEPRFCDVTVARWEKLTGGTAERTPAPE